jgi:hypothetical protein
MHHLQNKLDIGPRVCADLAEFRLWFSRADEAYRRFRRFLIDNPVYGDPENNPIEWLPISNL